MKISPTPPEKSQRDSETKHAAVRKKGVSPRLISLSNKIEQIASLLRSQFHRKDRFSSKD